MSRVDPARLQLNVVLDRGILSRKQRRFDDVFRMFGTLIRARSAPDVLRPQFLLEQLELEPLLLALGKLRLGSGERDGGGMECLGVARKQARS